MSEFRRETWAIAPHDPLVLAIGRRLPALLPRMIRSVPLPATLAGAVRARFVQGNVGLNQEQSWDLLENVSLRGPWLQQSQSTILVPAPLHVRVHGNQDARSVEYPKVEKVGGDEGFLLPEAAPSLDCQLAFAEKTHKAKPLDEFIPLDTACAMLLGEKVTLGKPLQLIEFEGRVHVTINESSQTAEPGALYSSSGARYADEITLGVEVTAHENYHKKLSEKLFVLGGETRVVAKRKGLDFPGFDAARYENAIKGRPKGTPGLLLMLVTPASFSTREGDAGPGWLPPWLKGGTGAAPGLDGVRFKLEAIATNRFIPLSGWSMAHRKDGAPQGRQRAVRRLVPPGTVYFLRIEEGGREGWRRACAHFWGRAIDEQTPGDREALLAAPHRDGYGMVLPGLYWPDGGQG